MSRIGRGSVQFLLTVMHKIMYIFVWYLSHGFIFKFMRCRYIFESTCMLYTCRYISVCMYNM